MTNIRFIKKHRHPRRNEGETSLGEKGIEENNSSLTEKVIIDQSNRKKIYESFLKKYYQINFK